MIFAHGSIGFFVALTRHAKWKNGWFLVIAYIGGIFPDIDLFYTYFINGLATHRTLVTHTPALYILVAILLGGGLLIAKRRTWAIGVLLFNIGALTHMVADGIVGQIMYAYPFSHRFFGLSDLGIEWLNSNILAINFILEGCIITAFFYALISMYSATKKKRIAWTSILLVTFACGLFTVVVGNNHIYRNGESSGFDDVDNDGIANIFDDDIDGDGIPNIDDLDADNDGKGNVEEITEHSEKFFNVWYDPTEGGLLQVPVRLGLVTNDDIVRKLFASVGIYIATEMEKDYTINPDGYVLPSTSSNFDRSNENIRVWLEHLGKLETGERFAQGRHQLGDILFFESGHVAIVTGITNKAEHQLLDIHKNRISAERFEDELVQLEGEITARGKMLSATALYADETLLDESVE